MSKIWKAALTVAALSLLVAGAIKLSTTSTPIQAQPVPLGIHVPEQCRAGRIQVPTSHGIEWKQLMVCPDNE